MASQSNTTKDHDEIRRWAEERGGKPAHVTKTESKGDIGILRIEFPGATGSNDSNLEEISWDQFFEKFDERGLALLYQEETADGQKSNFNKLLSGGTAGKSASKRSSRSAGAAKKSTASKAARPVKKTAAKASKPTKKTAVKASAKSAKKAAPKTAPSKRAAPAKRGATKKVAGRKAAAAKKTVAKKAPAKKKAVKKAVKRRR